jgi:hypothetical protein
MQKEFAIEQAKLDDFSREKSREVTRAVSLASCHSFRAILSAIAAELLLLPYRPYPTISFQLWIGAILD